MFLKTILKYNDLMKVPMNIYVEWLNEYLNIRLIPKGKKSFWKRSQNN